MGSNKTLTYTSMLTALKISVLYVIAGAATIAAQGQTPQTNQEKKTDTVAQRVIRYFNRRQADSVYALTGDDFKKQVPYATWNNIAEKQMPPMLPFKNPVFVSSKNNVNKYKIESTALLQLLVGLDEQGRINALLLQPYQEENVHSNAMTPLELKTDTIAQSVLACFNAKQPDSVYAMAGPIFKNKITAAAWKNIFEKQLLPLGPFLNAVFIAGKNGVNKYKIGPLQFLLGIDKESRIETLAFQPYHEDARKAEAAATDNTLASRLDSTVDKLLSAYAATVGNEGVSAGIYCRGKDHFYNYGETAKDNRQLPTQNTLYEIGSITKTFTATLLAKAVTDKKVSLNDPITRYLPDSVAKNNALAKITLLHLADHTSGLPRLPANLNETITDPARPYENYDQRHLFSFLKNFHATRLPGASYEYSNLAVGLLGVIMETVYKKPYGQLVHDMITTPLHLNNTAVAVAEKDTLLIAQGYADNGKPAPAWNFKALAGAGALKSSAADLLQYGKQQLAANKNVLSTSFSLAHRPVFNDGINKVGLGWHYLPSSGKVLQHGGGTGGYRTMICIDPEENIVMVLLTNNATNGDALGIELMQALEKTTF